MPDRPQKRANYDRFGTAEGAARVTVHSARASAISLKTSSAISSVRSPANTGASPSKGNDLRYDLDITLMEAAFGVGKDYGDTEVGRLRRMRRVRFRAGENTCYMPELQRRRTDKDPAGVLQYLQDLRKCGGAGKIITDPCKACKGQGKIRKFKSLSVKIPAGVDTGSRLRVSGEGEMGLHGGPRGDLYIYLNVEEHPFFKRDGNDLYCDVPVSFPQAALGAEIEVPTIDGTHIS